MSAMTTQEESTIWKQNGNRKMDAQVHIIQGLEVHWCVSNRNNI